MSILLNATVVQLAHQISLLNCRFRQVIGLKHFFNGQAVYVNIKSQTMNRKKHFLDFLERSVVEGLSMRVVPLKPGVITIDVRVRNIGQVNNNAIFLNFIYYSVRFRCQPVSVIQNLSSSTIAFNHKLQRNCSSSTDTTSQYLWQLESHTMEYIFSKLTCNKYL